MPFVTRNLFYYLASGGIGNIAICSRSVGISISVGGVVGGRRYWRELLIIAIYERHFILTTAYSPLGGGGQVSKLQSFRGYRPV